MQTVEVPLSNGKGIALIDECDAALVFRSKWSLAKIGYAIGWRFKRNVYLHRLIMGLDSPLTVDHINGNKLDNRRCNLRFATRSQNYANVPKRSTNPHRFKGITRLKSGRWMAQISFKKIHENLGCYGTDVEAALAYDERAKQLFGEFAQLNFQ